MAKIHFAARVIIYCIIIFFHSAVYKCVCQQHSDKLYKNLMHLITNTLMKINNDLEVK